MTRALSRDLREGRPENAAAARRAPYRLAMSMLTFYINRAGDNVPDERRRKLEKAKEKLRGLYGKKPG